MMRELSALGMNYILTVSATALIVLGGAELISTRVTLERKLEQFLCRVSLCSTERLLERATAKLLDPQPGVSPIPELRGALERDSEFPYRWCDLGDALAMSGDDRRAALCYSHAVQRGPNSPQILIRAANFALAVNDNVRALELMNRILRLILDYDELIFSSWERLDIPMQDIVRVGLKDNARAARSYLDFVLNSARDKRRVQEAWASIASRNVADDRLAGKYVGFFLQEHEYDRAVSEWVKVLGSRAGEYPGSNLIYNGGFEQDTGSGPFNFTVVPSEHVSADRDQGEASDGKWSLRLVFDGTANLNYSGVTQQAVVSPGTYRFRARMKASRLTTDRGLAFSITDAQNPARLNQRTNEIVGTTEWVQLSKDFRVPQGTRLLQVSLTRDPSLKFESNFGGTAWIDSVTLIPLPE